MNKVFIGIIVCAYLAGLATPACCQYTEGDDSAIEQTESRMGESLDSELSSEKADGTAEMGEANEESAAGEPMTL